MIGSGEKPGPFFMSPLYTKRDILRPFRASDDPRYEPYRSPFRKDYGRLLHSPSFRRLQGKTQLFPGADSEFFRNRLTHSLEVAQIAKCIALQLNARKALGNAGDIDTDLVEFAGLAHDLGHPPFGHVGEEVLNELMWAHGGFEGNAQTLRILSNIEHKVVVPTGKSFGLNLTYRSLGAILKYDQRIAPRRGASPRVIKGYYASESDLVRGIKAHVAGSSTIRAFKTIECTIMDIADDIAYSTYDLEDSFKARFLSPLDLIVTDGKLFDAVLAATNKALRKEGFAGTTRKEVYGVLETIAKQTNAFGEYELHSPWEVVVAAAMHHNSSNAVCMNDEERTAFTSQRIGCLVSAVKVRVNRDRPALSFAYLDRAERLSVEVLKHLTFETIIRSHRLRIVSARGHEIVSEVFGEVRKNPDLLPDSVLSFYNSLTSKNEKMRCICDFVASMTDRQAVDFYARLRSEEHKTIFKPVD
jgi:dGTPase